MELEQAARTAFTANPGRTALFEWQGRRYVAKRLAEKSRPLLSTLFIRWLVQRITGQSLPLNSLSLSGAARSVNFEVDRLQNLAQANVPVPRVVLKTDCFFVLDYCGPVVATLLEQWPPPVWRQQLVELSRELAAFHRAGHWHGGAQIKNITQQEDINYRIDFEENFGLFLPLPISQLNDLLLFLNSISLAGPIDETESRHLLPVLIETYFTQNPDEEIRDLIRRLIPWLRWLAHCIRPFQRLSKKGIRRILILSELLQQATDPVCGSAGTSFQGRQTH